jgi:hypothetical protein
MRRRPLCVPVRRGGLLLLAGQALVQDGPDHGGAPVAPSRPAVQPVHDDALLLAWFALGPLGSGRYSVFSRSGMSRRDSSRSTRARGSALCRRAPCAARRRMAAAGRATASSGRTSSARTRRRPGCGSTSPVRFRPTGCAARRRSRRRARRRAAGQGQGRRPGGRARRRRRGACWGWRPSARTGTRRPPRRGSQYRPGSRSPSCPSAACHAAGDVPDNVRESRGCGQPGPAAHPRARRADVPDNSPLSGRFTGRSCSGKQNNS